MRYLIKYSKETEIKFIAHLDLMRTIQRMIRRAELPIEYSKGFNPHMAISIAQPLSVGMYSDGEYMDIVLTKELEEEEIVRRLNENAPKGIKIIIAKKVEEVKDGKKVPQGMALIDEALYTIYIRYENTSSLIQDLEDLKKKEEWNTIKKGKNGEKEVNIKPLIKKLVFEIEGNRLKMEAALACGSREHLSAQLLADFIKEKTKGAEKDAFIEIKREEMYAYKSRKLVPLYQYV